MSARALPLVFFPLAVMLVGILLSASAVPNQNGSATATFCSTPTQQNCVPANSPGTTYYCDPTNVLGYLQACKILPSCVAPPYPDPAFCIGDVISAAGAGCLFQFIQQGSAGCGVYLKGGFSVFIATKQIASSLSTTGAFFGYVGGGAGGFITMIGVAVGIISLAGLTVFGSGEQGEGLHILFQGGMVMGLWLLLSGLEGFPGGNDVMFAGLNVAIAGAGTFIYALLTLSVVGGFLGLVSRGA